MSATTGAVPPEFTAALDRVKGAITTVGTVVTDLRAKISTSMSAEEVAEAQAVLDSMAATLNGIAADPLAPPPVTVGFKKK